MAVAFWGVGIEPGCQWIERAGGAIERVCCVIEPVRKVIERFRGGIERKSEDIERARFGRDARMLKIH